MAGKAHAGCTKCGGQGKHGGGCPQCDMEEAAALQTGWRGGKSDLSQVRLHATVRPHGADDGSQAWRYAALSLDSSSETQQTAEEAQAADYCSPTGRFTSIPSGTLAPTIIGSDFKAPFDMNAMFDAAIPCTCALGVYRQEVRGYYKFDGRNLPLELLPGTWIHPTNFQEDGTPSGFAYGHREQAANGNSLYKPDQAGGCEFHGHDEPGLNGVTPGHTYEVHLDFRGSLKDLSNNSSLVTQNWSVVGTHNS